MALLVVVTATSAHALDVGTQRVDGSRLSSVAQLFLGRWLAERAQHFDVSVQGDPATIECPPGTVGFAVRSLPAGQMAAARMQVWVDLMVDERFVRAVPVVFAVHAYRAAWVAVRDVRTGQPLIKADIVEREVDVATLASEAVLAVPDNVRLRKPLLAGDVLTASHTERRPPVAQGAMVVVRSRIGAFAIEARAEALQDGRLGQPVWVRVAAATGPVLARVVEDNTVELGHD